MPGLASTEEQHSLCKILASSDHDLKLAICQDFILHNLFCKCMTLSLWNMLARISQPCNLGFKKADAIKIPLCEREFSLIRLALFQLTDDVIYPTKQLYRLRPMQPQDNLGYEPTTGKCQLQVCPGGDKKRPTKWVGPHHRGVRLRGE